MLGPDPMYQQEGLYEDILLIDDESIEDVLLIDNYPEYHGSTDPSLSAPSILSYLI